MTIAGGEPEREPETDQEAGQSSDRFALERMGVARLRPSIRQIENSIGSGHAFDPATTARGRVWVLGNL